MGADTIRNLTSSLIAGMIVVGGMIQIYFLGQAGIISGDALLAILGPLIGGAAAWAFQRDSNAAGARGAERAVALGISATPTVTTSAGPPATTTITPQEPEVVVKP